jgi:hypothetical protein
MALTKEQIKKAQGLFFSDRPNISAVSERKQRIADIANQSRGILNNGEEEEEEEKGFFGKAAGAVGNFAVGAAKGIASTVKGLAQLQEKIPVAATKLLLPKKFESSIRTPSELIKDETIEAKGTAQKAGFVAEQVGEFFIPVTKASKATKAGTFVEKLLSRGKKVLKDATEFASRTFVQSGGDVKETTEAGAIAGAVGVASPVASKLFVKPVTNVIKRLFKGIGSGLSGVGTKELQQIIDNPKIASEFSKAIKNEGIESSLKKNSEVIMNGVSNVRKEARSAYGKAVEALSGVEIKADKLREKLVSVFDGNGIKFKNGKIDFSGAEILDKKIQNRAYTLINGLNERVMSSGKDLRVFLDKLEASKFKSALDPDRQALNNLIKDMEVGIKETIGESSTILKEANKVFSKDMQLVEGIEAIFGKVNFKNLKELNAVSKKLERLFSQKGLSESTINSFLERIGVGEAGFKTEEAVRGILSKTSGANTKGLTFSEILQQATSSVVTPEMVKNISIATGLSSKVIDTIIKNAPASARLKIIKSLYDEITN